MDNNTKKTQLSAPHHNALLNLFGRLLQIDQEKLQRTLPLVFGEKITYGLLAETSGDDFSVTREAFKDASLVPPTALLKRCLKIIGLITPQTSVCPACHNFPISEDEIEKGMQQRGICPVCNIGKIEVVEVKTEHLDWTTGQMVPLSKKTNTTTEPGLVLPLTEAGVWAYLGQTYGMTGNAALETELRNQKLDYVSFLLFLRESLSRTVPRLKKCVPCLKFLTDPYAFDIDSAAQLTICVEDAVKWIKQPRQAPMPMAESQPIKAASPKIALPAFFFVDGYRLNWPHPNIQKLYRLLASAYDERDATRNLLRGAGIQTSSINMEGSATNIWHSVLSYCNNAGVFDTLVQAILADDSRRGYHAQYRELLALDR